MNERRSRFQVAQHLAKSYGDRAFAVAKMAAMTGKRWPIIGKKMHPEFPYIDAEIRCVEVAGAGVVEEERYSGLVAGTACASTRARRWT